MKKEIVRIQRDALARIAQASDRRGVEDARVAILGKKGELTLAQTGMKDVPREEKPAVGQLLNEARKAITEALDAKLEEVQAQADKAAVAGAGGICFSMERICTEDVCVRRSLPESK